MREDAVKRIRERNAETLAQLAKPIEHPGDVCECGHTRERHGFASGGEQYCGVKEPDENGGMSYVDECEDFVLAETALDRYARQADAEIREFDRAAADELTRLDQEIDSEANRQADAADFGDSEDATDTEVCSACGHRGRAHACGMNACTADTCSCVPCDECGHSYDRHGREAGCVECTCVVGMAVLPPERPADAARCGACGHATQPHMCDSGACDQYACECPPCGECGHPSTTRGLPDGCCRLCECVTGMPPVLPAAQEQAGYDGYAVTYAVVGGQQFTLYVPNGANVAVLDGQVRIYHADQPILGITDVHTREA